MFGVVTIDEFWLTGSGAGSSWDRPRGFARDIMPPQSRDLYNLDPLWNVAAYADRTVGPGDAPALLYNAAEVTEVQRRALANAAQETPPVANQVTRSGNSSLVLYGLAALALFALFSD